MPKSNKTNVSRKKSSWLLLCAKVSFTLICMLAFYGLYLDWQIRSKMDGQIWRLPAEVYSRIERISLEEQLSFEQVKQRLLDNDYRQTTLVAAPGDFKVEKVTPSFCYDARFPFLCNQKHNVSFAYVLNTINWQ